MSSMASSKWLHRIWFRMSPKLAGNGNDTSLGEQVMKGLWDDFRDWDYKVPQKMTSRLLECTGLIFKIMYFRDVCFKLLNNALERES